MPIRKSSTGKAATTLLILSLVCVTGGCRDSVRPEPASADPPVHGPEHMDHDPRYGGIFFMALDYRHHLEGALEPPGAFRLYLYDARTQPLPPEQVRQARGTLHRGMFPDPPALPLSVSEDGLTLEVALGREITFPVELTLLLRFPGMTPDARPELFNFTFDGFSHKP